MRDTPRVVDYKGFLIVDQGDSWDVFPGYGGAENKILGPLVEGLESSQVARDWVDSHLRPLGGWLRRMIPYG